VNTLRELHADIDSRVQAIAAEHPGWLCRKGCDGCCRSLAEVPRLTEAEWRLLREGLAALPEATLRGIARAMTEFDATRPIICPLLDRAAGACRVYDHRPVACRTYGFYVQRDLGLYCRDIEARVSEGRYADVVWGNQDIVDRRLKDLGDTRDLPEWFEEWFGRGERAESASTTRRAAKPV
jgi:Fe-S-cluster containining protein